MVFILFVACVDVKITILLGIGISKENYAFNLVILSFYYYFPPIENSIDVMVKKKTITQVNTNN